MKSEALLTMTTLMTRRCLGTSKEPILWTGSNVYFRMQGKGMFSKASVSHSVHRRERPPLWRETPSRQRPLWTETPIQRPPLIETSPVATATVLLECILVVYRTHASCAFTFLSDISLSLFLSFEDLCFIH